ncbi:MAG: hypothetical protein M1158_01810 [Candidatus Marsarchaeota archaeon]|nr:hypothetical protein [Candidatus Marsarchaeota archaeon]
MEFWNDELTDLSWKKLIGLRKELEFVLIGGWAVYLYTKLHKSKDIDIIVDYPELRKLQADYTLSKNDRLKRYEVKLGEGFDIDVYVPGYSRLALPIRDIIGATVSREGFTVPKAEVLILLKLGAYTARKNSIKGSKDAIDIIGLLFCPDMDLHRLKELAVRHGLYGYLRELLGALDGFDPSLVKYLGLNANSFSKLKRKYRQQLLAIL